MKIDSKLASWGEVKSQEAWSGLLLGNGASCAVWNRFRYRSLYEVAKSDQVIHALDKVDLAFFKAMQTTNFEEVLSALAIARKVQEILDERVEAIDDRYESIRVSLVEAVHAVHVPWRCVPDETLDAVRRELRRYGFVYSTNYDLLVYWSVMHKPKGEGFTDYFFAEEFDTGNTEIRDANATKVLYLHGGLHLYRRPIGGTLKRRASGANLLELFGMPYAKGATPLFVSEGTSRQKLRSIYGSDYLSFGYSKFQQHEGPAVVFGHSMGSNDAHLVDAVQGWGARTIAIGMMPGKRTRIIERKAVLKSCLPEAKLLFFDSTTHPLGDAALGIVEEDEDQD